MVLLSILFYLFIIIGLFNVMHIAGYLIGGNIYDAMILARVKKTPSIRKKRPLVSILVPAFNEELVISRCLDSIRKSKYKKIEVIVVNDASSDATARTVKDYQKKYQRFPLRLVSRRTNQGKASGLNYIARRYAMGELVMTLDADSYLRNDALGNIVRYFDDPGVAGVAANVRVMEELSVLGLLQRFEHMIAYRSKKLYTVLNCEMIIGGVASTYRRSILKLVHYYDRDTVTEDIGLSIKIAAHGNKQNRLMYAANVVAITEGVKDFKALLRQRYRWKLGSLQNIVKFRSLLFSVNRKYSLALTWYRFPMAYIGELLILLEPVIFIYIIYLTIRFLTPYLILSAYVIITVYLLLVILPDENLPFKKKIKATLFTPIMYFIFYIMNAIQLISITKCLMSPKQVVNLTDKKSSWVSPERTGRQATYY